MSFSSTVFPIDTINTFGIEEQIVKGGRALFPLLQEGFKTINKIVVLGWGSQGPAQGPNLHESMEESAINLANKGKNNTCIPVVSIGLREGSSSFAKAEKAGFSKKDGTLGEMFTMIKDADLVIVLISDAAQSEIYQKIFDSLKPGATLGFSHGFILGHLNNVGAKWPEGNNVIMVAPKGMGPSVRQLYIQGKSTEGAGINSSFAVEQDFDGNATNIALAWSIAIGSPVTFQTTMESEFKSDIFGERGILLGAVWGLVEALYPRYKGALGSKQAFINSVESITGPISRTISQEGIIGVYNALSSEGRSIFQNAYLTAYNATTPILKEIYDEVSSGNEIRSVISAGSRLQEHPMKKVDGTEMWITGSAVRKVRDEDSIQIDPFTAGCYVGIMMAQVDLLLENGHSPSEVANESIIEAVDSLNPYMHKKGISYMVDNCSNTARLGTYKWGPRFMQVLNSDAFVAYDRGDIPGNFEDFLSHQMHNELPKFLALRPSVNISL